MTAVTEWPSRPPDEASILDYATMFARVGFPVFPVHWPVDGGCSCGYRQCDKVAKHPATKNGWQNATTDLDPIQNYWTRKPRANIGIATGLAGLAVIDVDPAKGGRESFAELIKRCGPELCATLKTKTGRGGDHWYFAVPAGVNLQCSVNALAPGLDVRAAGGYVVAPPSLHELGSRYTFDPAFWGPPALLGDALLTLLQNAQKPLSMPSNGDPIRYVQGERNSGLASLAGAMRRRGMTTDEIAAALHVVNRNRCDPPMTERDVDRIASSVGRYQPQERRGLIAREAQSA
jgi:putative DNA primase/helicase